MLLYYDVPDMIDYAKNMADPFLNKKGNIWYLYTNMTVACTV